MPGTPKPPTPRAAPPPDLLGDLLDLGVDDDIPGGALPVAASNGGVLDLLGAQLIIVIMTLSGLALQSPTLVKARVYDCIRSGAKHSRAAGVGQVGQSLSGSRAHAHVGTPFCPDKRHWCRCCRCVAETLRQPAYAPSLLRHGLLGATSPLRCCCTGELNGLSVADSHAPTAAAPAAGIADLFGSEPAARTAPALPTVLTAGVQPQK